MHSEQVSSAEDFRQAAAVRAKERGELLTLPSGLRVLAKPIHPMWYVERNLRLPQDLAASVAPSGETAAADVPIEMARFIVEQIQECVLSPRISLNPGPDEISPHLLSDDDMRFLLRYARGLGGAVPASRDEGFRAPGPVGEGIARRSAHRRRGKTVGSAPLGDAGNE